MRRYIFVFALDMAKSLDLLEPFYELHKQINENRDDVPIVLCGTKSDVVVRAGSGSGSVCVCVCVCVSLSPRRLRRRPPRPALCSRAHAWDAAVSSHV